MSACLLYHYIYLSEYKFTLEINHLKSQFMLSAYHASCLPLVYGLNKESFLSNSLNDIMQLQITGAEFDPEKKVLVLL